MSKKPRPWHQKNKLNLKFALRDSHFPAGSYLAWLAQSDEQWVMQNTVVKIFKKFKNLNMVCYIHDGMIIESPVEVVNEVKMFISQYVSKFHKPHNFKFE